MHARVLCSFQCVLVLLGTVLRCANTANFRADSATIGFHHNNLPDAKVSVQFPTNVDQPGTHVQLGGRSAPPTPVTPPTIPPPATKSRPTVTMTFPTPVPPATATSAPGPDTHDLSKIINILFAILLVVTAILLVITGLCLTTLRRRFNSLAAAPPKYEQLKPVKICHDV